MSMLLIWEEDCDGQIFLVPEEHEDLVLSCQGTFINGNAEIDDPIWELRGFFHDEEGNELNIEDQGFVRIIEGQKFTPIVVHCVVLCGILP